jgi:hypothetical protein
MNLELGPTLREARIRRKIDLSEIEARTKIRIRYLRALENEEWDVLPGGAYTRSFIRTYATFLGLDGERMADEFRRLHEDPGAARYPHAEPLLTKGGQGGGPRLPRLGRGPLTALIAASLIGILILIGVVSSDEDEPSGQGAPRERQAKEQKEKPGERSRTQAPQTVGVQVTAIGTVWVCMVDKRGAEVIDGQTLAAGQREGPFRSPQFDLTFGNGQVALAVNGRQVPVTDSANPIGYRLSPGEVRKLAIDERPTCT